MVTFYLIQSRTRTIILPFSFQNCNIVINFQDPPLCNIVINREAPPIPYYVIYRQPLMSEAWKLSRSYLVCLWQCLLCGTISCTCTSCFQDVGTTTICPFCFQEFCIFSSLSISAFMRQPCSTPCSFLVDTYYVNGFK